MIRYIWINPILKLLADNKGEQGENKTMANISLHTI